MNTIFSFQSNKTHYTADACIVWCFDDRFSKLLDEYIKDLASPENEPARAYLLDQIAKSIKLHHTKEIILMAHSECGAYGGSTDVDFYTNELQRARESVQKQFPDITVECIYADFELLQHV